MDITFGQHFDQGRRPCSGKTRRAKRKEIIRWMILALSLIAGLGCL